MAEQLDLEAVAAATCGGCSKEVHPGQPTFVFDAVRYHVACVPAEHSSRAQSLLGVKSC